MKLLLHLQAILLLPFLVTVVVPIVILLASGRRLIGWGLTPPLDLLVTLAGALFVVLGLLLAAYTISLFFHFGEGTLAPWTPTRKLVVRGIYRHVRNPMITGVWGILLGESLMFGSPGVVYWFGFVLLLNLIYIPLIEEPDTESRFGEDYRTYKRNVPRWIPQLRPWMGA
ncbi:MAG TPA: isoprenylcysteine carboxylmethyltransferase family protein [Chloroflexia bacterium]|nr:isoprenylcysteine carboxylmethyltransferase family protein [Chloroflexia bacterium]